jgi:hypothetical protein
MRVLAGVLCLSVLLLLAVHPPAHAAPPLDRPHTLAAQAPSQHATLCVHVTDAATCHQLPAGCGPPEHQGYDPYLAFLKNQTIDPASASALVKHTFTRLSDITALDASTRALGLNMSKEAGFAAKLADLGQGEIDVVLGYLYYAESTGAEACNCRLTDPADTDVHIGIGFDPMLAERIRTNAFTVTGSGHTDAAKRTSIVVEMTPHYRARFHPTWTRDKVAALKGRRVKVVGQLLVDADHNEAKQDCAFPHAVTASCWRASTWELHPVTQFFVCKQGKTCTSATSTDWQELDAIQ